MKKYIITTLFSVIVTSICLGQDPIDSLFWKFKQPDFYKGVYPSKNKLENYQKEIIPRLITLLNDTTFVKLSNTADLIYPGATEFYGHGHFVPYDLDWISVRAGWLLEELTFQNFGYSTSGVDDDYLFKLMKENYNEYLNKGTYDLEWKNRSSKEKLIEYRKILAQKVTQWWKATENSWTRLNAIKEALRSNDEKRLSDVLQFLRYGETKCEGLNKKNYQTEIKLLVTELRNTKFENIKTQVGLLLKSSLDYRFQKMKELEEKEN